MLSDFIKRIYLFVIDFVRKSDTRTLFSIPFALGILLGVISGSILRQVYGYIPKEAVNYVGAGVFLLMGLGGVVFIVRKEFPLYIYDTINGTIPLVIGVIWVLYFWGMALIAIWRIIGM